MATSENGRPIIWYNTTCDSWGACNENALVVVYADELTDEEHAAYLDADHDEAVRRIVVKAAKRAAADADPPTIYLSGNIGDGFWAYGPYADYDHAFAAHDNEDGWAMSLLPARVVQKAGA